MFTRLSLALLVVLALPAAGQSGTVKGKANGRGEAKATHVRASEAEIRIVREYYSDPSRKPKPIPPGIWKNLGRGKKVPPGMSRTRLPGALVDRMPRRDGAEWWIAGDRVLLIDTNNNLVDFFLAIR
jgi:hypothetical protein